MAVFTKLNQADISNVQNIFGFKKNLYNKNINVIFNKFIRPEKKFKNIIELKNQIRKDIKLAK